jgi:iron complex transport system substrate-binding protein
VESEEPLARLLPVAIETLLASVVPTRVDRLRRRVERVARIARELEHRPTLTLLESIDPPRAASGAIDDLIRLAGGTPVPAAGSDPSESAWEKIVRADPDRIVVAPRGSSVPRTRAQIDLLTGRPEYAGLQAVARRSVYVLDGDHTLYHEGPRLVDGVEILAQILHPGIFPGLIHLTERMLFRPE